MFRMTNCVSPFQAFRRVVQGEALAPDVKELRRPLRAPIVREYPLRHRVQASWCLYKVRCMGRADQGRLAPGPGKKLLQSCRIRIDGADWTCFQEKDCCRGISRHVVDPICCF